MIFLQSKPNLKRYFVTSITECTDACWHNFMITCSLVEKWISTSNMWCIHTRQFPMLTSTTTRYWAKPVVVLIWFSCVLISELKLNRANSSDTEAPYLDLNLCISNGTVSTKFYDKRDDFDFDIVIFPILDGDVLRRTTYLNLLDSPELLQILVTLTAVIKPLQPNFLGRDIVILNFVRRFRNFIADTVPW